MVKTNESREPRTIGGHFSAVLENRCNVLPGQYGYESARAGLFAVLKAANCRRVFIPYYVCDAVPSAIRAAGCEVDFYSINAAFEIDEAIALAEGDLVLLVDYYGLCRSQIENQLGLFPKNSVIVDCSQAWFQAPFDCLATIYSPRKFLPVPDGGVVHTSLKLETQEPDERSSLERYQYLLERVTGEPEASRELYLESEAQLELPSLRGMSAFTRKLIEVADQDFIKARRAGNWDALSGLGAVNRLGFEPAGQAPICYPLMFEGAGQLRDELRKERVFAPLYWPGVTCTNAHEKALVSNTLYLPIDHRYGEADMARLLEFFKEHSVIS
ncbi:hypothetical protein [Marinobacter sp.]|uniref:hypothetical protein n=1 Tax=Marinobacter sp. TaxID=50741 RepID=UPI003A94B8CF